MELRTFDRDVFLYVNVEDGSQYRDKSVPNGKKIESYPENVEEFTFTIKTVPAKVSMLGTDAALRYSVARPRSLPVPGQAYDPIEESKQILEATDFSELLPQSEVEYSSVAASIVKWNLTQNGAGVEPSADALKALEPAWLYDYIKEAYDSLNQIDDDMRRD